MVETIITTVLHTEPCASKKKRIEFHSTFVEQLHNLKNLHLDVTVRIKLSRHLGYHHIAEKFEQYKNTDHTQTIEIAERLKLTTELLNRIKKDFGEGAIMYLQQFL